MSKIKDTTLESLKANLQAIFEALEFDDKTKQQIEKDTIYLYHNFIDTITNYEDGHILDVAVMIFFSTVLGHIAKDKDDIKFIKAILEAQYEIEKVLNMK